MRVPQGGTQDGTGGYDGPAGAEALGWSPTLQPLTTHTLACTATSVAHDVHRGDIGLTGGNATCKSTQDRTSAYDVPAGVEALSALLRA